MFGNMLEYARMKLKLKTEALGIRVFGEESVRRQNPTFRFNTDVTRHQLYFGAKVGQTIPWDIHQEINLVSAKEWQVFDQAVCLHTLKVGDVIDRYTVVAKLGYGAFGKVYKLREDHTNKECVAKMFSNTRLDNRWVRREYHVVRFIHSQDELGDRAKHFVKMHDYFNFQKHSFIVYEHLDVELKSVMHYNRFNLNQIRLILQHIFTALDFLASLRDPIIHADIKPENIMLRYNGDQTYTTVLIDFGLSRRVSKAKSGAVQTREYRAPEVLLGYPYNEKIDIWSTGVVGVEIFRGGCWFTATTDKGQIIQTFNFFGIPSVNHTEIAIDNSVMMNSRQMKRKIFKFFGVTSKNINCFTQKRIGVYAKDIVQYVNLLEKLLRFDPEDRYTAGEALRHPFFKKFDATA